MKKFLIIITAFIFTSCAQQSLQTNPDLATGKDTLKRIAAKMKDNGDLKTALQIESQLIKLDDSDAESYVALSKTLREVGANDDALSLLFKAEKNNPLNDNIKISLAKSLLINDQPEAAISKLEEVTTTKDFAYYNTKGVAYDTLEDYATAQATYKQGLMALPKNGALLNNLALSHLMNKQPRQAIAILEALVKRPELKEKYRHNLALAYGLSGKNKKAYNILLKELPAAKAKENLKYYKEIR